MNRLPFNHEKNYSRISNNVGRDKVLTGNAKAVYLILIGLRHGFPVSLVRLVEFGPWGVDAVRAAVQLLEKHAYLDRSPQQRRPNGMMGPEEWTPLDPWDLTPRFDDDDDE